MEREDVIYMVERMIETLTDMGKRRGVPKTTMDIADKKHGEILEYLKENLK